MALKLDAEAWPLQAWSLPGATAWQNPPWRPRTPTKAMEMDQYIYETFFNKC